jgi:hypothetical protein
LENTERELLPVIPLHSPAAAGCKFVSFIQNPTASAQLGTPE